MDRFINRSSVGQFVLDGASYFGNLTIDDSLNKKILLTLYLPEGTGPIPYRTYPSQLHGTLHELTTVTLLDCVFIRSGFYTQTGFDGGHAISGELIFDVGHVLFSCKPYVDASQPVFSSLEFSITNSNDLFYYTSCTQVIHADEQSVRDLIQEDLDASKRKYNAALDINDFSFGESPVVLVYTGARVLSEVKVNEAELEIRNNPNYTTTSNEGFKFENPISCHLKFDKRKNYWEIVEEVASIMQLFELILGHKQSIKSYTLEVFNPNDEPDIFNVFRAVDHPRVIKSLMHPLDRLIHVENEEDEFSLVINNWLSNQEEWKFARNYYFSIFREIQYNSDTLVKLSNMFDLVPDDIYGKETLTEEVLQAAKSCRAIFKPLPQSLERQSIMFALKRISQKTLKHKIQERYEIIQKSGFIELADMDLVIKESVDCRNFFVHGSNKKFDYFKNFNEFCFFIDSLIFIYGVSEMIQNGWTFNNWKPDLLNSHLFSRYILNYDKRLGELKEAIDKK